MSVEVNWIKGAAHQDPKPYSYRWLLLSVLVQSTGKSCIFLSQGFQYLCAALPSSFHHLHSVLIAMRPVLLPAPPGPRAALWQVSLPSHSSPPGWRLFFLDHVGVLEIVWSSPLPRKEKSKRGSREPESLCRWERTPHNSRLPEAQSGSPQLPNEVRVFVWHRDTLHDPVPTCCSNYLSLIPKSMSQPTCAVYHSFNTSTALLPPCHF